MRMALRGMLHKMNDRLEDVIALLCEKNIIVLTITKLML
jgi:hypothetical protein